MKDIITLISVLAFVLVGPICARAEQSNVQITANGTGLEIVNGKNRFIAEAGADYSEHLRIYGVNNVEPSEWSPMAYASYILVASPYTGNTQECERADAEKSAWLMVIVQDQDVKEKISRLNDLQGRRRATLTGQAVAIKQFFFEGEDHSDSLQPQGQMDPRQAILVKDVTEVTE